METSTFDAFNVVKGEGGEDIDEEAPTNDVTLRDELWIEDLIAVLIDEGSAEVDHNV